MLNDVGLAAFLALVLLCAVVVWALTPQRAEMLWVVFVASFAALPFTEFRWWLGSLSVPVPAFVGVLVAVIIGGRFLVTRDLKLEEHGILLSLALMLLGTTLSIFPARAPEISGWHLLKWFFHASIFVFLLSFRERMWHFRTVVTLTLITGAMSAYGLAEYVTSGVYDLNFYKGVGTRSATGLHLSLILPLALSLGMTRELSLKSRLLVWIAAGISVIALVFTYSRTAWLSVLVALFVMGVIRGRRISRVALLSLFGFGIVYLGILAPVEIQERFWSIFSLQDDPNRAVTNAHRLRLQAQALREISSHPFLGVGLGNYVQDFPWDRHSLRVASEKVPHNFYLTIWVEAGILAFIGFISMLFLAIKSVARGLNRAPGSLEYCMLLGSLGALVSLATFLLFADDFNNILVWTVLGLAVSAKRLYTDQAVEGGLYHPHSGWNALSKRGRSVLAHEAFLHSRSRSVR